jgi:hypothetical protein
MGLKIINTSLEELEEIELEAKRIANKKLIDLFESESKELILNLALNKLFEENLSVGDYNFENLNIEDTKSLLLNNLAEKFDSELPQLGFFFQKDSPDVLISCHSEKLIKALEEKFENVVEFSYSNQSGYSSYEKTLKKANYLDRDGIEQKSYKLCSLIESEWNERTENSYFLSENGFMLDISDSNEETVINWIEDFFNSNERVKDFIENTAESKLTSILRESAILREIKRMESNALDEGQPTEDRVIDYFNKRRLVIDSCDILDKTLLLKNEIVEKIDNQKILSDFLKEI